MFSLLTLYILLPYFFDLMLFLAYVPSSSIALRFVHVSAHDEPIADAASLRGFQTSIDCAATTSARPMRINEGGVPLLRGELPLPHD